VLSVNEGWLDILLTPMRDQITVAETCRRCGISRQTFYVYQRQVCRRCGSALQEFPLSGRRMWACPVDQPRRGRKRPGH